MKHTKIKLREVYLPFLIVAIGTLLIYNAARWTLSHHLDTLPINEDILNFWLPFALPWIPVLIWLRKRVSILQVKGKRESGYFFYQFMMVLAIMAPLVQSQHYFEKALYDLVEVESVDEIRQWPKEKYFSLWDFNVDQEARAAYVTSRTSGKNNTTLIFYLYYSSPFANSNSIWYGVKYEQSINNLISDKEKEAIYQNFLEESEGNFKQYKFRRFKYFEKLGFSDDRDGFVKAIKLRHPNVEEKDQVIIVPRNERFEDRLGNTFPWIVGSFGIGALVIFLMVVIPPINQHAYSDFRNS